MLLVQQVQQPDFLQMVKPVFYLVAFGGAAGIAVMILKDLARKKAKENKKNRKKK